MNLRVAHLKHEHVELQNRVEELEQYSRIDNIIISGLPANHKSYASATRPSNGADNYEKISQETECLENIVANFINENITEIDVNDILTCHALLVKRQTNSRKQKKVIQ